MKKQYNALNEDKKNAANVSIATGTMGKFWDQQPTAICRQREGSSIIVKPNQEDIPTLPGDLPPGYTWKTIESADEPLVSRIKNELLDQHYLLGGVNDFRLVYSQDQILDYLKQGKFLLNAVISFVAPDEEGNEETCVGFVAAAFRQICIAGKDFPSVEVNFLCVHSDHKGHGLAAHLIREITRKANRQGVFTAIHTSGKELPVKSFCTSRYYHKFLDIRALNEAGYTTFSEDELPTAIKHHQHKKQRKAFNPIETYILRPFTDADIPVVADLFEMEQNDYVITEIIHKDRLRQMKDSTYLDNYVIEEVNMIKKTRRVAGFVSVCNSELEAVEKGMMLKMSNINVHCGQVFPCIGDLLSILQSQGTHVINCLDVGKNKMIARLYNMLPGTGYLRYYMYNYRMPMLSTEEVGYMVL